MPPTRAVTSIPQLLTQCAPYAVAAGACAVYTWEYFKSVAAPKLFLGSGPLAKLIVERCPTLQEPYWPAPLAFSAHAQTMLTVLRQGTALGNFYREVRGMRDGGCIALDWWRGSEVPGSHEGAAPIVLILHGITGGSQEGYVKWMCRAAERRGWRAVVMNYRGCAGLALTTPVCYNAVHTHDIHEAVEHICQKFPEAPIFAVGYSLGALLLTKYTAEADSGEFAAAHAAPAASAAVGAPATPLPRSWGTFAAAAAAAAAAASPASEHGSSSPTSLPPLRGGSAASGADSTGGSGSLQPFGSEVVPAAAAAEAAPTAADSARSPTSAPSDVATHGMYKRCQTAPPCLGDTARRSMLAPPDLSPARSARGSGEVCVAMDGTLLSPPATRTSTGANGTAAAARSVSRPIWWSGSEHTDSRSATPRGVSLDLPRGAATDNAAAGARGPAAADGAEGSVQVDMSQAAARAEAPGEKKPSAQRRPRSGLSAAVVVSNPFCMATASHKISKPWTMPWIYNLVLTFRLKQYIRRHAHQVALVPGVDCGTIAEALTLYDFDAAATCKATGFPSVEMYYAAGSSAQFIPRIRTPTLFLVSSDDPFLGDLPIAECAANPATALVVTAAGGHCAHLEGLWPLGASWADRVIAEFLEAVRPAADRWEPHASLQHGLGAS
eukprot:jgi/Ulvmu1/1924/UM012_0084.1